MFGSPDGSRTFNPLVNNVFSMVSAMWRGANAVARNICASQASIAEGPTRPLTGSCIQPAEISLQRVASFRSLISHGLDVTARQNHASVTRMRLETKFLRLKAPVTMGSHSGDWQLCGIGGWTKHRLSFLVMVVRIAHSAQ
jgi:hypothetical protein